MIKQVLGIKLFMDKSRQTLYENNECFIPLEGEESNLQILNLICRTKECYGARPDAIRTDHTVIEVEGLNSPDENSHWVIIHKGDYAGTVCMYQSESENEYGLTSEQGVFYCVPKDSAKALPYFDEVKEQWKYVS